MPHDPARRADGRRAFDVEPSHRRYRLRLARYRHHPEALARTLPPGPTRVLDAGCGKGRLPLYWRRWGTARHRPSFVGIDVSESRLERARARSPYEVLVQGDLRASWPFHRAAFDAVVCEQVLEHLDDAEVDHAFREMRRTVVPGGVALIGVPIFTRPRLALAPLWRPLQGWLRRRAGRPADTHLQHFDLASLRAQVAEHGFSVEAARGFRLLTLPANLLEDQAWWYRLQQALGRRFPGLCGEVTLVCRRQDAPRSEGRRS